MGNAASLNPFLTSQLLLAKLCFFHLPVHPETSSCLLSKFPPPFEGSAVIWEEAKRRWESRSLHQFLSACPLTWTTLCRAEELFSLFLFSSLHRLAVKTDLAVIPDDVITWIAWLWFHFSRKWKCKTADCKTETAHQWSRLCRSFFKIQVKAQMHI